MIIFSKNLQDQDSETSRHEFKIPVISIHLVFLGHSPGKKIACGTVCLSTPEATYVSSTISTKLFAMARTGEFSLQGFPNFDATLADLRGFQKCPKPEYSVCLSSGNSLIVREALIQFWQKKHPEFADRMDELVRNHDKEFNQNNLKRGLEQEEGEGNTESESPTKKLRLTQAKTLEELEKEHSERLLFMIYSLQFNHCLIFILNVHHYPKRLSLQVHFLC